MESTRQYTIRSFLNMRDRNVPAIVVVKEQQPIGILTLPKL